MSESMLESVRAALKDRYDVEREIGRGGMAMVYLAQDPKHRRAVAIKVLRADLADEIGHERFLREIETAAGLAHPHILPLHDSGDVGGWLYYVMPYIAGESLRERIVREGQLPVDDAIQIACDVADALGHAHSHGVVHRDIKPANILLAGGHAVVADFGIAKAISAAQPEDPTGTGAAARTAIGTPTYMSPEQCTGSARLDGRSDLYSLGCVLYEMLAGRPPFEGSSPGEICAQHYADSPPPLSEAGRNIPLELEQVVRTALAKAPADRFATALQFVEALPAVAPIRGSGRVSRPVEAPRPRRRWRLAVGAMALVATAAAFTFLPRRGIAADVDADLYVVLPFGHRQGAAPELLDGDGCESLLYEGFSRWTDIRLVDALRVHDAKARRGDSTIAFEDGLAMAEELGAGRLVWGQTWELRDTVYVRAAIYDVGRRGKVIREHTAKMAASGADMGAAFAGLADSLLLGAERPVFGTGGPIGTNVLAAWRMYQQAHKALAEWDLERAEREFRGAAALDQNYAQAHFWLAQVLEWAERPSSEWGPPAQLALANPAVLGDRYSGRARALVAMASQRFSDACAEYDALIARDSMDFTAWFGRGECRALDRLVQRDAESPSGWRFRASYHTAMNAYVRALQLVPAAHAAFGDQALDRLGRLLFTESNNFRSGFALDPDTVRFAALPALAADTLTFIPYPMMELLSGAHPSVPARMGPALQRNRRLMRSVTESWARAFPASARAQEAYAYVLEVNGDLRSRRSDEPSALASLRAARRVAVEPAQRLRLAVAETRVLLKLAAFDSAKVLADSLLRDGEASSSDAAVQLASLAALTGRLGRTTTLLGRSTDAFEGFTDKGEQLAFPPAVGEASLRFLSYAALGAPSDSLRALNARIPQLLASWVEAGRREDVRQAAFGAPVTLAFPALGRTPLHTTTASDPVVRMQAAALGNDPVTVRATLAGLAQQRRGMRIGDEASDRLHQSLLVQLAIGDTAAALQRLDALLSALPTLNREILGSTMLMAVPQAASLPRLFTLRADLAAAAGDTAAAERWAGAVMTLWADADPLFEPVVTRMRALQR